MCTVPEEDPNAEPCHWLEVEHVWGAVYSTTFSPPPGVTGGSGSEGTTKVGFSSQCCRQYRHSEGEEFVNLKIQDGSRAI